MPASNSSPQGLLGGYIDIHVCSELRMVWNGCMCKANQSVLWSSHLVECSIIIIIVYIYRVNVIFCVCVQVRHSIRPTLSERDIALRAKYRKGGKKDKKKDGKKDKKPKKDEL